MSPNEPRKKPGWEGEPLKLGSERVKQKNEVAVTGIVVCGVQAV